MLPHITIYTDSLPENVGGRANGPVVRIRPKYRNDTGIHAHEYEHVRQWYFFVGFGALAALFAVSTPWWPAILIAGAGVHPLLYLSAPEYKLWSEVEAYKVQARQYADDRRPLFACFIAQNYELPITQEKALSLLKE